MDITGVGGRAGHAYRIVGNVEQGIIKMRVPDLDYSLLPSASRNSKRR